MAMVVPAAWAQAPAYPAPPPAPGSPGFVPPALPTLEHERTPVSWPVPDYFDEALQVTGLKPGERAAALHIRIPASSSPLHVVLPVQTQAFGFAAGFRALAGAQLDRQLEIAGLDSTRQTDAVDAYGPFVRRFDAASVEAFAAEHGSNPLVALYLGHDGIDKMFVTLVVRRGAQRTLAHRTVDLPADAAQAIERVGQSLPAMFAETGLAGAPAPTPRPAEKVGACADDTWELAPLSADASASSRACRAIVVGALLPFYDVYGGEHGDSEAASPAKQAWLAQAYVLAGARGLPPDSAQAIRDLAWKQLGLPGGVDATAYAAVSRLGDPVLSRLGHLLALDTFTEKSPASNAREARRQQVERMTQGLPAFAAAVVASRADFDEMFSTIDLCAIERELPGMMLRATCRTDSLPSRPAHPAWPAQTLLYQEWRLAAHYKAVAYAGQTLGSRAGVAQALASWPADVAAHPYLQRLRYSAADLHETGGSFDEQLQRIRDQAGRVLRTSVDLQRADRWLASHSLTNHLLSRNTRILGDRPLNETTDQETRLLSVLRFDRFTQDRYAASRRAGDPAIFAGPMAWLMLNSGGMRGLVVMMDAPPGATPAPAPSRQGEQRPLFAHRPPMFDPPSQAQLAASLERNPADMRTRMMLALSRLQEGSSADEAMRLIDANPQDRRPDHRVGESSVWAYPGHLFYFAGEPEAARKYYRRVVAIGSGSESDLMARIRVQLLDGHLRDALVAATARVDRYDSDYARRDQAGLMFMLGQREAAWQSFLVNAAASDLFQLWVGAYVGHRQEGADAPQVDAWMKSHKLDSTEISFKDVGRLYDHLLVVTDRVPTDADIERLQRPLARREYLDDRRFAASARLVRSALEGNGFHEAQREATAALRKMGDDPSFSFMLPLYAWAAWQATGGKDETLDEVRRATLRSDFDELLAKSMVLALDGDRAESLRWFKAARYQLALAPDRILPAPYSLALAGILMHRKTGDDAYRRETLGFVRAEQSVFPYLAWLHGMEALLDTNVRTRKTAACRAQHLDERSYFLALAQVKGTDPASCRETIATWLN